MLLNKHSIELVGEGKALNEVSEKGLVQLATLRSAKMSQLIQPMLKESDNLYADSLFLAMGEKFYQGDISYRQAGLAVKRILKKYAGISLNKAVIVDGSGVSRYNLITPNQLVSVLSFLYQQFPISYEFLAGLSVAGRDGTLYKRHLRSESTQLIRAKTGTMQGVVSLAGFLPSKNGHPLAFAIMINGIPQGNVGIAKYRVLEDELAKLLLTINVKSPILQKAHQVSKQTPFPFERGLNAEQKKSERNRLDRVFERNVRKALKNYSVKIVRAGNYLEVLPEEGAINQSALMTTINKALASNQGYGLYQTVGSAKKLNSPSRLILESNDEGNGGFRYRLWRAL
jgi:D-alanyl-D-alanine carboxypeptidase/D-alanyl-D-alanine-endopeptidase (penicillin-binding protein 4)